MSNVSPAETTGPEGSDASNRAVESQRGMSPYATGGGGVTFERKVAVQYLAHLLVGDGASELGDGRRVVSVEFQQAPSHPVDDLVVHTALHDEPQPSRVLALGVRRSPDLVVSDESTRRLIRQFVHAVINAPSDGLEHRWGLVVAGSPPHVRQLAELADLATKQMDAPGFFDLVHTPKKFDAGVRGRLDQIEKLVKRALHALGGAKVDTALVQQRTWQLLARLTVSMPRLESPDETDWSTVANSLIPVARRSDLTTASQLRDRLVSLVSEYSPKSARVDLKLLRRDAHALLDPTTRRHQQGWQRLNHLESEALAGVHDEIKAIDDARRVRLDRSDAAAELVATAADAEAVVVSGESGVGKSALAVIGLTAMCTADADSLQALCINLRHIPKRTIELEAALGCPLSNLLCELSAPQRLLIVDAADTVAEGMTDAFRYLVRAAATSEVKVIAVTSIDSKQVVRDILTERFATGVAEHSVRPLSDTDIDKVIKPFTELGKLNAHPRSREILRRLVVVDLLVRGRVHGVPLSDSDAMQEVWSGLVRRHEVFDRGSPDARELALLRLADLYLSGGDRLDVISGLDPAALDGLRRDGLLRTSPEDPFIVGPEFAHDEVRRYAVARLLLSDDTPVSRILQAGAPRWSLSAANLACQAWLQRINTATMPITGRFSALQEWFDGLIKAGHGDRWGDVPGEALLAIADPKAVLHEAWPKLLADDARGLRRLSRLVDQRLRDDDGIVNHIAVEPIITLLLEDEDPWRFGEYIQDLLREWLRAHVVTKTCSGHPLRIQLRKRLVEACAAGDRRLVDERAAAAAMRAARTPAEIEKERRFVESNPELFSEIGYSGRRHRKRPEVPREITDEIVLELLALLGPDLGEDGESILRRVARDAPSRLAPAVEELFTGNALANYGRGILAHLTEAYYLDDEADGSERYDDDGIRRHRARSFPIVPLCAWYRGPFMALFQTDPRRGVAVLNRLLNHAARVRVWKLAGLDQMGQPLEGDAPGLYQTELDITGTRRRYAGDEHVWSWYRGTTVGPYPCCSALQALERVCDQWIKIDIPIRTVVSILIEGCENLAMVGLVVGLLVRHLENADDLLDAYLVEPLIWKYEFARVVNESNGLAASSEGLVAPKRRTWSLREAAAMLAVVQANEKRAAELRALGEKLVANARRHIESTHDDELLDPGGDAGDSIEQQLLQVRAWASCLDRDRYQAHEALDGLYIQPIPPDEVVQALEPGREDLESSHEAFRLVGRYYLERRKGSAQPIGPDELATDMATVRSLVESPPSVGIHDPYPWTAPALVAAAALAAHLQDGVDLPDDALSFAVETVLRIGESEDRVGQHVFEDTFFELGADRSAARAIPLLILPVAARLRAVIDRGADGWTILQRADRAGINLAQAVPYEVRLHLARGLDHVWNTPCMDEGRCDHHEMGWRIATETMRRCLLGGWAPGTGRRSILALEEPITESLARADGHAILATRLDAAIRALATAAMANICVSRQARDLLSTLLDAQQRSLLSHERDADPHGSHALVSARALLTLAEHGDDGAIYSYLDSYADNSTLLDHLLRALSAAAEETPDRAATARRIWPKVVRHVLALNDSDHTPFQDRYYGDQALAALMPNAAGNGLYLYREIQDNPIVWWTPLTMRSEVEAWLAPAAGKPICVNQLISFFFAALSPEEQARTGLPWVAKIVLKEPTRIAGRASLLSVWLIEIRSAVVDVGRSAKWQELIDALVVAGVTRLAPYSE